MATSTADIPHGTDDQAERRKSGPEDGGITVEMNPTDATEANPSAFPNGLSKRNVRRGNFFLFLLQMI